MDPYNPYSPPATPIESVRFETMRLAYRPAEGMGTKWIYFGVSLAQLALTLGSQYAEDRTLRPFLAFVQLALLIVSVSLVCVWIHAAWSGIPRGDRGEMTPGGAVGRLFIPVYNVYWMFAVSLSLCDVLNVKLQRIGSPPVASRSLAISGCIFHFLTGVAKIPGLEATRPFVAVIMSALWFAYMLECDKARAILARNTYEEERV